MLFLLAKLYQLYKRKGDLIRLKGFLHVVFLFFAMAVMVPFTEIVNQKVVGMTKNVKLAIIMVLSVTAAHFLYRHAKRTYFAEANMELLVQKYKANQVPAVLLYLVIVITPIFVLMTGFTVTCFLAGGMAFGHHFPGILK